MTEPHPGTAPGDPTEPTEHVALPRPRVRVGAAVWGAIVAGAGALVLWLLSSPTRRAAAGEWLLTRSMLELGGLVAVAFGAAIAVLALVAAVRRAQLRRGGSR